METTTLDWRKEQEKAVQWWNELDNAVRVYLKEKYYKKMTYRMLKVKNIQTIFKKETTFPETIR